MSLTPSGRQPFYKMSGSGNDFVVIDATAADAAHLADPQIVRRICARGTGVGADGIVFLEASGRASVRLVYFNADGSRAAFCGNATLCGTRLSAELGLAEEGGSLSIETDDGLVQARMRDNRPEIDLPPVTDIRDRLDGIALVGGESQIGFAQVGVPHAVIRCSDASLVDVVGRGRPLRAHQSFAEGANVNFLSGSVSAGWTMRTYERGVEAETLACGSGAVASAIFLAIWGEANPEAPIALTSRSGLKLSVRLRRDGQQWFPSLSGEGRIVFHGNLDEI